MNHPNLPKFTGWAEDQSLWPASRMQGWAPGVYMCQCGTCGKWYSGDKRSVTCWPCVEKARAFKDAHNLAPAI